MTRGWVIEDKGPDALREELPALVAVEPPLRLAARAYTALRAAITARELGAGRKLSVPALARQLNVSRTPVAEALARLEQEGLVVTVPNRGPFVAFLGADDVREIYEVREVLEGLVARLAALRADGREGARLRGLLGAQDRALHSGSVDAIMRVDMEFHRRLRVVAGNRRLAKVLQTLQDQVRTVFATSITIPGRREGALAEHREILASIERRDPDAAERAARTHISQVRAAVLARLASTTRVPAKGGGRVTRRRGAGGGPGPATAPVPTGAAKRRKRRTAGSRGRAGDLLS